MDCRCVVLDLGPAAGFGGRAFAADPEAELERALLQFKTDLVRVLDTARGENGTACMKETHCRVLLHVIGHGSAGYLAIPCAGDAATPVLVNTARLHDLMLDALLMAAGGLDGLIPKLQCRDISFMFSYCDAGMAFGSSPDQALLPLTKRLKEPQLQTGYPIRAYSNKNLTPMAGAAADMDWAKYVMEDASDGWDTEKLAEHDMNVDKLWYLPHQAVRLGAVVFPAAPAVQLVSNLLVNTQVLQ
jgi:hypothetical protein